MPARENKNNGRNEPPTQRRPGTHCHPLTGQTALDRGPARVFGVWEVYRSGGFARTWTVRGLLSSNVASYPSGELAFCLAMVDIVFRLYDTFAKDAP